MRRIGWAAAAAMCTVLVLGACKPKPPDPPAPTTTTTTTTAPAPAPAPVALDVANSHGCALLDTGSVRCWGNDRDGQLGDGSPTNAQENATTVAGLTDATEVALGEYRTCALRSSGAVACWGNGIHGQLGNGTTGMASVPVPVTGLDDATSIAVADSAYGAACATRTGGTVWCWGSNERGMLGTDDLADDHTSWTTTPVQVEGISDAVEVRAGMQHMCARRAGGGVACWGDNQSGQLGDPTLTTNEDGGSSRSHRSVLPVHVAGLTGATGLTLGSAHTCATTAEGVRCWGSNWTGQLGNGTSAQVVLPPTLVVGGHEFDQVDAGGATCGIEDGAGYCWGPDAQARNGQIGNPGVPDPPPEDAGLIKPPYTATPLPVTRVAGPFTAIANGPGLTCAARADRSVRCWGSSALGAALGMDPAA